MGEKDLSLVSLDDLMVEIDKRFDIWIFSGMQLRNQAAGNICTVRKWKGNSATCAGLASQMQVAIFDVHIDRDNFDDGPFEE
jgi:hypothetical protein